MRIDSLWYEAKTRGKSAVVDVSLRRCPNCGEVKILSNPCGFDHLAALLEFRETAASKVLDDYPPGGSWTVKFAAAQPPTPPTQPAATDGHDTSEETA